MYMRQNAFRIHNSIKHPSQCFWSNARHGTPLLCLSMLFLNATSADMRLQAVALGVGGSFSLTSIVLLPYIDKVVAHLVPKHDSPSSPALRPNYKLPSCRLRKVERVYTTTRI